MATFASFLDQLSTARAAGAGIAAADVTTDANAPDLDELVEASADRAEHAGDGPDVVDQWEPSRPILDETHVAAIVATVRSVMLGSPTPGASTGATHPLADGVPVQIVPPAGGRRRRVTITNHGAAVPVYLSPERQDVAGYGYLMAGDASVPVPPLETSTTGAIWARSDTGAGSVSVWVDYFDSV